LKKYNRYLDYSKPIDDKDNNRDKYHKPEYAKSRKQTAEPAKKGVMVTYSSPMSAFWRP
jgi:hypothetical protein